MSWKKTTAFFFFQSIRRSPNWNRFREFVSYYPRWMQFQAKNKTALEDELPWLNFPALDYMEQSIRPDFRIFEYGGGGSSLFFCKRAAEVITVEHDPDWFSKLKSKVVEKGYSNWQGILQLPEKSSTSTIIDQAVNSTFTSKSPEFVGFSFEKYVRQIECFPEGYFDLILIDGRARTSCITVAISRLCRNGILIVDNTERKYYLNAFKKEAIKGFTIESDYMAPIGYTPHFVKTSVFKKRF
ncbi:MAG: hypothetical protein R3D58_00555 [Saprospiraceae bacterium]